MLRLTYDDNGTSHDDITLQVGDFVSVSDSYYLLQCMDEEIPPQIRTRTCLAQMMAAWAKGVFESVSEVYLLAELHDEFTRWIRCDRNNDEFSVQLGWSTEAGHDLPPVRSAVRKEPPADWQECDNSEPFKLSSARTSYHSEAVWKHYTLKRFQTTIRLQSSNTSVEPMELSY